MSSKPALTLIAADMVLPEPSAQQVVIEALGHEPEAVPAPVASATLISLNTLDAERFGHDDAADFKDDY